MKPDYLGTSCNLAVLLLLVSGTACPAGLATIVDGEVSWAFGGPEQAQFQQPLEPRLDASLNTSLPPNRGSVSFSGLSGSSVFSSRRLTSVASATGAVLRASTDSGDLLGSSPAILDLGVQRRNPIVTEPRIRGSRVGALAASGSYWTPARIDLDTALSKIDSRIVDHIDVTPGPYTAMLGPGFEFIDVELLSAPRYEGGFESHGTTSFDYRSNGDQWYGRQSFSGGDNVWGFRGGYGQRTGNDYVDGGGVGVPSSYRSGTADFAIGTQLTSLTSFDFQLLRLDQTDIELAGQAFDIDWLVTDGYDLSIRREAFWVADELVVETWYNRTRFEGSSGSPGKQAYFPYLTFIDFVGSTDVDSTSAGHRTYLSFEGDDDELLAVGTDLRYVTQELNEVTSAFSGLQPYQDANSPIPESYSANPGLFAEYQSPLSLDGRLTVGGRVDWVAMNISADPAQLDQLGVIGASAADILGSEELSQNEVLAAAFFAGEYDLDDMWTVEGRAGYAERAPNLTERYAVEPFMFLLQNGLNTVTGDPELDKERRIQIDIGVSRTTDVTRLRGSLYHAWTHDYVTFEAMSVVMGPPGGVQQTNLKYVNTDLATHWGAVGSAECDLTSMLTPFGTLRYTEGTDRTRNGEFATRQANSVTPSEQVAGLSRGSFSGLGGNDQEALPGILPLESRIGVRLHGPSLESKWEVEISARLVAAQDRVAASLLESATPGFTTWDIRGYLRPNDRLLFLAGIENFTDRQYREHLDFRSLGGASLFRPGLSFYTGAEINY